MLCRSIFEWCLTRELVNKLASANTKWTFFWGGILITSFADGCFGAGKQRAYAHILLAVSIKALRMLCNMVDVELSPESKNMR